jgi:membrane protein CcdC involved in cytochrome C biogenesis
MQTLGMVAIIIGYVVCLAGGIWFLVEAFRESILWGLGCLLLGPVSIVFLILHWDVAKRPFFLQLKGLAVILIAVLVLHARLPLIH